MIAQTAAHIIPIHYAFASLLYIGPGMDGGSISLIIAFLISFFTFLISIVWYPVKKTINFFKRIFGKTDPQNPATGEVADDASSPEEKN